MNDILKAAASAFRPEPDRKWLRQARPEQIAPPGEWSVWLTMAGRGFGKTRGGAEWLLSQAVAHPSTDWAVVAPTFGSARDICAEGPSGLLRCAQRGEVTHYVRSLGEIRVSNGSRIYLRSADEHERLRGLNLAGAWLDEAALFAHLEDCWHASLMPAVRHDPGQVAITTTPRPRPLIKDLLTRTDGSVVVTRGSTFDNEANLSRSALLELRSRYEGTRLGRSELGGELLEDNPDALWTLAMIDRDRVTEAPTLDRVVVGVDPSGTSTGDEAGIVVAGRVGRGGEAHYYVLADHSLQASPEGWARAVSAAYSRHRADRVVAETNFGADLVVSVLRNVASSLPVSKVTASRGKLARAEPVAALAEQGRLHHVGVIPELESELTTWTPGTGQSPNRMDAMVWAVSALDAGLRGGRMRFRGGRRSTHQPDPDAPINPDHPDNRERDPDERPALEPGKMRLRSVHQLGAAPTAPFDPMVVPEDPAAARLRGAKWSLQTGRWYYPDESEET